MPDYSTRYAVRMLRHGQTPQNADSARFYGSGPDKLHGRGQIELTDLGQRQARAAALASRSANIAVAQLVTSNMPRAIQTGNIYGETYGDIPAPPRRLTELDEISHGSVERLRLPIRSAKSEALRRMGRRAMMRVLVSNGLDEGVARDYGRWLTPLGRGDGETYLDVGVRASTAIDQLGHIPDTLIVGHSGSLRQARMLLTSLTRSQRNELAQQTATITPAQNDTAAHIQSLRNKLKNERELEEDELVAIFAPLGRAAKALAKQLGAWGVPHIGRSLEQVRGIGNGVMVELGVNEEDGRWWRKAMITPVVLGPAATSTGEYIGTNVQPYGQEAAWV